jgi:formylglycine-generating enzyme required for sulfatase activity
VCTRPPPAACVKDPTSAECRLPGGFTHVLRGGGWSTFSDSLRGVIRGSMQGGTMTSIVGFRCVYPAP